MIFLVVIVSDYRSLRMRFLLFDSRVSPFGCVPIDIREEVPSHSKVRKQ